MIRRLRYALMVLVGVLFGVEGLAFATEGFWDPPRTLPTPEGGSEGALAFRAQAAAARKAAGIAEPPALGGTPQPHQMVQGATGPSLPAGGQWQQGTVAYRINSLGLRGPEISPRAEDEERILTVGDSSIFGDGVEEPAVFSSVAARAWATARGKPVSAVIGAVPGSDSGQALQTLRAVGPKVQPTVVVIGCVWSDVYRAGGSGSVASDTAREGLRRSAAYRLLRLGLGPWLGAQKVGWIDGVDDVADGTSKPARVAYDPYVANLRGLAEITLQLGATPVFVMLPAPMDFDRAALPPLVLKYRQGMREVASSVGAPLIDGPALFIAEGSIADFLDQVHPAPTGHARLGEALAKTLSLRQGG